MPLLSSFMYSFIRLKYKDHLWAKGMASGQRLTNTAYAKAFDIYISLDWASFKFYCNYERGEYLALKLAIFNFGYTNLNSLFDDSYYESNDA